MKLLQQLDQELNFSALFNLSNADYYYEDFLNKVNEEYYLNNDTIIPEIAHDFSLSYRLVATILHAAIFVIGVVGNVILIAAVKQYKALRRSTYAYLSSLAIADLLVLCTAVPEAIVSHHLGKRWIFGSPACAIFIFTNFLGINAGSLSILTFTIERYVAVCHPLRAYWYCTLARARRINVAVWIIVMAYSCPWLAITEVNTDLNQRQQCKLRLSRELYSYFFIADLIFFYLVPLMCGVICYGRIAAVMAGRRTLVETTIRRSSVPAEPNERQNLRLPSHDGNRSFSSKSTLKTEIPVNRMLIAVLVLFAIAWCPFRFLLVYNTFATRPWLNLWFLLFAKTMIYANSAINPIIYTFMSQRFRRAVETTITFRRNSSRLGRAGSRLTRQNAVEMVSLSSYDTGSVRTCRNRNYLSTSMSVCEARGDGV